MMLYSCHLLGHIPTRGTQAQRQPQVEFTRMKTIVDYATSGCGTWVPCRAHYQSSMSSVTHGERTLRLLTLTGRSKISRVSSTNKTLLNLRVRSTLTLAVCCITDCVQIEHLLSMAGHRLLSKALSESYTLPELPTKMANLRLFTLYPPSYYKAMGQSIHATTAVTRRDCCYRLRHARW